MRALALVVVWVAASFNAEVDAGSFWADLAVGILIACITGFVAAWLLDRDPRRSA